MVEQVAIDAVQFYRGKGISKDAAVAIVSVLWFESKLRPGSQGTQSSETPGTLNPGGAYGIASWNGPRQAALASFAAKKGLPVGELNTQLAFVLTEAANSYPKTWAAITSIDHYSNIIAIFVADYENPKDHEKEINAAIAFVPELWNALPVEEPIPSAPTLPPAPVSHAPLDPALVEMLAKLFAGMIRELTTGVK